MKKYKEIEKDEFVKTCKNSNSMAQAAEQLNIPYTSFKRLAKIFNCWEPNQGGKGYRIPFNKTSKKDFISGNHELRPAYVKERAIKENLLEYKCYKCGNKGEWMGENLRLQLNHKDGNRFNNAVSNLELLCPNCHDLDEHSRNNNKKYNQHKYYIRKEERIYYKPE